MRSHDCIAAAGRGRPRARRGGMREQRAATAAPPSVGGELQRAARRHGQRRRRDVPAPVYQRVGGPLQGARALTVNYQASAPAAASRSSPPGTVDFGATDAALSDEEITRGQEEGRRRSTSRPCFGAVTVSYNVAGVEDGPQARRPDARRHLPRQDHEVERPGDRQAEPGREAAGPDITVFHRSDESGTTKIFTDFLADYSPDVEERPGRRQDREVADRHRRQGQRRRRRLRQAEPTARSATSSWPTRCRTSSPTPR